MTKINPDMIDAVKVQFIKPIFEDDFVEKGMVAWLTDVEWESKTECYNIYLDFSEFEDINQKYFKRTFYSNKYTANIKKETGRELFTALETHNYEPKYSVYFSISTNTRDDRLFEKEILNYLRIVHPTCKLR